MFAGQVFTCNAFLHVHMYHENLSKEISLTHGAEPTQNDFGLLINIK